MISLLRYFAAEGKRGDAAPFIRSPYGSMEWHEEVLRRLIGVAGMTGGRSTSINLIDIQCSPTTKIHVAMTMVMMMVVMISPMTSVVS